MGKHKVKNVKKENKLVNNDISEDNKIIKEFIITLGIVILVVGALFLVSYLKENNTSEENTNTTINYDIASAGTILNRPYDEYYVILYDSTSTDAIYYDSVLSKYKSSDDAKKIYYVDLNDGINSSIVSNTSSLNVSNVKDLKVSGPSLLLIKNGKVSKSFMGEEKITNELS